MSTSNLSKEEQVLEYVLSKPEAQNSPEKILEAIEEFSRNTRLMIVGRQKGAYVLDAINEKEPTIMVELGCYVGYSAVLFGLALAKQNRKYSEKCNTPAKYYSFEISPKFASIAQKIIDYAGLSATIEIFVGAAGNTLSQFQEKLRSKFQKYTPVDIVFIDHAKDMYVPDYRVLESQGLIAPGTIVIADNIFTPGAPDYVRYVQGSPQYRRDHNDNVRNVSNPDCPGRWNILYESRTVPVEDKDSGHKDAVEITRCVSYLSG